MTDIAKLNRLLESLGRNLRKILPDDWDFSLVVWRVIETAQEHDKVEVAMISQGNPDHMKEVLLGLAGDIDTQVETTMHKRISPLRTSH